MMSGGNYTTIENQKISGSVPAVSNPGHVAVKFKDSNLETFPPAEAQGKILVVHVLLAILMIHSQNQDWVLMNLHLVVGFAHLQLLHINLTLMLTYQMF